MKIVTWNVNGLRACLTHDFVSSIQNLNMDILCLQETKLQQNQIPIDIDNIKLNKYFYSAKKKGYSGTAIFSEVKPHKFKYGIGDNSIDDEGRTITTEYKDFYLVNAYVPNAQPELKRLDFRINYEKLILKYLKKLDKDKPIIYCGDLNVAHEEIDLKNPKSNIGNPGFSIEERNMMSNLLDNGFIDVFRSLYPKKIAYTWWSYRQNARANDVGWRIDYFIISKRLIDKVKDIIIHNEIYGSDHCPVELILKGK